MRDDPVVTDLVTRAANGDKQAWDALVERYAPLIWSICRSYRLDRADAEDVGQIVWLHLVDQLHRIQNPAALAGWIATTTRRECFRLLRTAPGPQAAGYALDANGIPDTQAWTAEQKVLAAARPATTTRTSGQRQQEHSPGTMIPTGTTRTVMTRSPGPAQCLTEAATTYARAGTSA